MSDSAIIDELERLINVNDGDENEFTYELNDDGTFFSTSINNTYLSDQITDNLLQLRQLIDLTLYSRDSDDWAFLERLTSLTKLVLIPKELNI